MKPDKGKSIFINTKQTNKQERLFRSLTNVKGLLEQKPSTQRQYTWLRGWT